MIGGSSSVFATPFPTVESIHDDMIERSSYDPYDMEKLQATSGSVKTGKWTAPAAAKMRITRKTSDSGVGGAAKKPRRRVQAYEDHNHSSSMNQPLGVIRVCSDCNTTKTPLWRSGPCGPKVRFCCLMNSWSMHAYTSYKWCNYNSIIAHTQP